MKYKVGDSVVVHDRKMKVNSFNGKITGIEPNTDSVVYNVLIELRDKDDKRTGSFKKRKSVRESTNKKDC